MVVNIRLYLEMRNLQRIADRLDVSSKMRIGWTKDSMRSLLDL